MKKIRQGVGVLLCFCLLAGLIPATALAANPTTVIVSDTDVAGGGEWTTDASTGALTPAGLKEPNVIYDKATNTLTLQNATIIGKDSTMNGAGVYADDDLTIVAKGNDNTITGVAKNSGSSGIYCDGALTLNGTGALAVSSFHSKDILDGAGVNATGNITITGSLTLNASGYGTGNVQGINSSESVTISQNANVTANPVLDDNIIVKASHGIRAHDGITINGNASVTAMGLRTAGGEASGSYGMYITGTGANNKITIDTTGTVTAKGGYQAFGQPASFCGMYAPNVEITGGTVEAVSGYAIEAQGTGYGIYSLNNVTISGNADVNSEGQSNYNSYGI